MRRYNFLLLPAAVLLVAIQPMLASTVQVGHCIPNVQSYPTISAAVSGVTAGSIVEVCPGGYAEQVTITQPLTLIGLRVGTANQALITVPSSGLVQNTMSMFGEPVAAQVLVSGAGPVNISNIAIDGTGGDMGCLSWLAGIFYSSGSSGTVSQVRASGQLDSTCGVGIWAENSASSTESIIIRDSSVYNVDSAGIFAGSGATPSLSVAIANNVVNVGAAVAGIDADSVTGAVVGNTLGAATPFGVFNLSGSTVGTNTIIGATTGIFLGNGGTASGNNVSGTNIGVLLGASGATVSNNRIMSSVTTGVELGCFAASVSGNFINDAPIGVDSAMAVLGSNTFANTSVTVSNGCAVAAAAFRASTAVSRTDVSEWHRPATPFGTRTK